MQTGKNSSGSKLSGSKGEHLLARSPRAMVEEARRQTREVDFALAARSVIASIVVSIVVSTHDAAPPFGGIARTNASPCFP
jgi:hypothetical protein